MRSQVWLAALTFPVYSFKLILELINEAADRRPDGSQIKVSIDADR